MHRTWKFFIVALVLLLSGLSAYLLALSFFFGISDFQSGSLCQTFIVGAGYTMAQLNDRVTAAYLETLTMTYIVFFSLFYSFKGLTNKHGYIAIVLSILFFTVIQTAINDGKNAGIHTILECSKHSFLR